MPQFLSPIAAGTNYASLPLQVGTNTTTMYGGMGFGTDTGLWRVGPNRLACNRLDQAVPPVSVMQWNSFSPNATLAVSGVATYSAASFVMPYDGHVEVEFVPNIFINAVPAGNAAQLVSTNITSSYATNYVGPTSYYRNLSASDQVASPVPTRGFHTAVPSGTSLTYTLRVQNGAGAATCLVYTYSLKIITYRT